MLAVEPKKLQVIDFPTDPNLSGHKFGTGPEE